MDESVKRTLKWAAAAVAVFAITILSLIPYQKNKSLEQTAGISFDTAGEKPIEAVHSAMANDTNVAAVINKTTDKRLALFYNEEAPPLVKKQVTEGYTYFIIGGSYKEEINAQENAEAFKKKGFDATVLNVNDLYRVSLCQFDNKVNALHELRRIRIEEQNENVWLYSQK